MDLPTSHQKRILYVITKASWGGAQRYVYDLATYEKAQGNEVALLYGEGGLLATELERAGIRTLALPSLMRDIKVQREWGAFIALQKLIASEKPDIIHVNSSKGGLALLAARFTRVPRIIFTAHGWAFNESRPFLQRMLLRVVYVVTVLLSHTTICVSDAVARDVTWVPFIKRKLTVIRNGVDAPVFLKRAEARVKLGEVGTRTVLGMLAELHPTKRVEDAVRALKELKDEYPNLVLVVFGEGEDRERISALVEQLRLADSVMLRGFVHDASTLLGAFDMFLMPSRTEALGYAAIEAGYAGLPVIASRVGGLPEIIQHKETGLLVPSENPHALARAIRMLLEEPDYATLLGKRLKASVEERFQKARMLEETDRVYSI